MNVATETLDQTRDMLLHFAGLSLASDNESGVRQRPELLEPVALAKPEEHEPFPLLQQRITHKPLFGAGNMETEIASVLAHLLLPPATNPHVIRFRHEGWNAVERPDGHFIAISPYAPIEFLNSLSF